MNVILPFAFADITSYSNINEIFLLDYIFQAIKINTYQQHIIMIKNDQNYLEHTNVNADDVVHLQYYVVYTCSCSHASDCLS